MFVQPEAIEGYMLCSCASLHWTTRDAMLTSSACFISFKSERTGMHYG